MNEFNSKEVKSSNNTPSIAESLFYISARLDELSGCGMTTSQLNVYSENSEEIADGISKASDELSELNRKMDSLSSQLSDIEFNLRPLTSIAESLENIMMMYVESQKSK